MKGRFTRGRVKDVEILFGIDEDGEDEEREHQRDGTGGRFGDRLRCFGDVQRRDRRYIGRRRLKMELPGRRQRGESWMQTVGVGEDAEDKMRWRSRRRRNIFKRY